MIDFVEFTKICVQAMRSARILFKLIWQKYEIYLPLPVSSKLKPAIRSIPILSIVVFLIAIKVLFSSCEYRYDLTIASIISLIFTLAFVVIYYLLISRGIGKDILIIGVFLGWSIAGPLTLCLGVSAYFVWQEYEAEFRNSILVKVTLGGEWGAMRDHYFMRSDQPISFASKMKECECKTPRVSLFPKDVLKGGKSNKDYRTPLFIKPKTQDTVTVSFHAIKHSNFESTEIILLPDPTNIGRVVKEESDDQGNVVHFEYIVLAKDRAWILGSQELIALDGVKNGVHVCNELKRLNKELLWDPYTDIIAVGTASIEGKNKEVENGRAGVRAITIASWLNKITQGRKVPLKVHTLNLGQYRSGDVVGGDEGMMDGDGTGSQRRVLVIGVIRDPAKANLAQALEKAMHSYTSKDYFGFLSRHYTKSDASPFTGTAPDECN